MESSLAYNSNDVIRSPHRYEGTPKINKAKERLARKRLSVVDISSLMQRDNWASSLPNFLQLAGKIPAVALVGLLHLMIGIPFGVSYFPVEWRPQTYAIQSNSTDISSMGEVIDSEFQLTNFFNRSGVTSIKSSFSSSFCWKICLRKLLTFFSCTLATILLYY